MKANVTCSGDCDLGRIEFDGKHYLSDEVYLAEIKEVLDRINKKLDKNEKKLDEILKLLKAKAVDRITVKKLFIKPSSRE